MGPFCKAISDGQDLIPDTQSPDILPFPKLPPKPIINRY
jgi:hypothetical protein